MFGKKKPNYEKLTNNLRLAITRLKLSIKKKTELSAKCRKEIADLLAGGKLTKAKVRVEHLIRNDLYVEALEMVEIYCDRLVLDMPRISNTKEMESSLEQPISSLLWVTPRLSSDIKELKVISEQLARKYGKMFRQTSLSNLFGNVNPKLMQRLNTQPATSVLVAKYLQEIARAYNIPFSDPLLRDRPRQSGVDVRESTNEMSRNSHATKRLSLPVESIRFVPTRQFSVPGDTSDQSPISNFSNMSNSSSNISNKNDSVSDLERRFKMFQL